MTEWHELPSMRGVEGFLKELDWIGQEWESERGSSGTDYLLNGFLVTHLGPLGIKTIEGYGFRLDGQREVDPTGRGTLVTVCRFRPEKPIEELARVATEED